MYLCIASLLLSTHLLLLFLRFRSLTLCRRRYNILDGGPPWKRKWLLSRPIRPGLLSPFLRVTPRLGGLDYEETFSPVAKLNTVRVLISVAVHRRWPLFQLDVKNAFLNSDLQETVYMQQSPGFETTWESQVCRLTKALYGLKQSPRAWFDKFSKAIQDVGFTRSSADFLLFTRHRTTGTVLLLVYVDDIIITGDDLKGIQEVKLHLGTVFQTKDLWPLRYFLGLEIDRQSDGLVLSQRKYCLDLLQEAGYSGCKPIDTPMDANHKLCAQASYSDLLLQNPEYYRRLVRKLIFLTVTIPNISFDVGIASRYMHTPRRSHLQAVERILRYLKTAPGQGLVYKTSSSAPTLVAYSDVDYACSLDDRRSTSGLCTYLGGHLITWRSKKQAVVARSSAEAEYRAMTSVTSELTWLEGLLTDLGVKLSSPALLCDSQTGIHIAKNPVFHERTKHIEVDCHFIREKVQMKKLDLKHVPGTEQVADILTKALPSTLFYQCLSKLGAYDLYAPACGGVIYSLVSHFDSAECCGFDHDSMYKFATGSLDSKLIVWDTLCPAPISILSVVVEAADRMRAHIYKSEQVVESSKTQLVEALTKKYPEGRDESTSKGEAAALHLARGRAHAQAATTDWERAS
ncbi:hypothetical protein KSP39_PZI017093 [Platanthera zijinensis]|uniref:Reverse transcriptase Ty1/copia-type domain-containing protein n=1 Tax=Platanthera zijinensis TaxID=2320716 RepID=A0AAP0B578_9ASPA